MNQIARPRTTPSLGGVFDVYDEMTGEWYTVDDGMTEYPSGDMVDFGEEQYPGGGTMNPDQRINVAQSLIATQLAQRGAITPDEAAAIAARVGATSVQDAQGNTIRVQAVTTAPTNPDPSIWYKIGSQLLKSTGQVNAQGAPMYRQIPISGGSGNTIMYAGLAALAFLLLK